MKRIAQLIVLVGSGALLSACNFFSQPADLQTENLQNELAQTQIAAVRETATVNADRMLITLESAQTAVGNVNMQSTRIASTLIAGGMAFVDTSNITPVVPPTQPASENSPAPLIANPLLTPGAPQVNNQGAAQSNSALVPVTPSPLAPQATQASVDPNSPSLTNITVTTQVGGDDCPLNPTNQFDVSATEIYVTAVGNNIPATATLNSVWRLEGTQIQDYSWTPGFAVNGACIWFLLPASEVQFTPGNWSVELLIDGVSAGAPLQFTIGGETPSQIDVNS
jgi:hypothetical protein